MRVPKSTAKLNEFVDLVFDGETVLESPLRLLISKSLAKGTFYDDLKVVTDDRKRIKFVTPIFPYSHFRKILRSLDKVLVKNEKVMNILQLRGDTFKSIGDTGNALRCYSLALSFALTDSPAIANIYMKRSAIFVFLGKYDLALLDVDMAISHDKQYETLTAELMQKKEACLELIIPKLKEQEDLLRHEYKEKIISKVQGRRRGPITSLPEFITMNHESYRGRFLVTNTDLEPGTTVLVEETFVGATVDQLRWQTNYCDGCFKETLNPIPCEKCVYFSYCSVECRSEDQKHEYECPLLPYAHSIRMPKSFNLSLKAVSKTGPEYLKNLYEKSKSTGEGEDVWFVPLNETQENGDTYSQVLNMASHNRFHDMPFSSWLAISLSYALRIKTTFFDIIEESEKLGFESFLASIILHHSESFAYNTLALGQTGIEITDIRAHFDNSEGNPATDVAFGVYPLTNLMNHSCASTTFREHLAGGKIAIITNQRLKAGEELSHSYGCDYLKDPIRKRLRQCWEDYNFFCTCKACNEKWPMSKDTKLSKFLTFMCPACKTCISNIPCVPHTVMKFPGNNKSKCSHCESNVRTFNHFGQILDTANEHVLNNRPLVAIPLLIQCIQYFQPDSGPPPIQMIVAQARLMDSYDLILNTVNLAKVIDPIPTEEQHVVQEEIKVDVPRNRKKMCCII